MSISIDEARDLMHEWVESPSLRTHMESVASCMAGYADKIEPDHAEVWIVTGLLHDLDYEKHPTAEEHPFVCAEYLKSRDDVPAEIVNAILAHADYSGVPRETDLAKHLFAVDELAGFIVACARVRPEGIGDLQPKSVKKKLKDKAFAAAVDREDIRRGAEEIGLDITDHIANCIEAMRSDREHLGI